MLPSLVQLDNIEAMVEMAKSTPHGSFVEVGVYQGGTAWHLSKAAEEQGRSIYLYDTFTGIPFKTEVDDRHEVGEFGDTSEAAVRDAIPYATVVKGGLPGECNPDVEGGIRTSRL